MEEGFTFYCKRTLSSTIPVPPPRKIHHLSNLDRVMENHHLEIIYYYKTPMGLALGEISANLRESLSQTLTYFPVVIGRLMKNEEGQWMVKCNDCGLRLVQARVKGSVESWLANVDDEKEKKLVHWEEMPHNPCFWSPFNVQVTEFEEGGLALGFSCAHSIADPISASVFMKAWADTTLSGRLSFPPFFHPLPKQILGFQKSNPELNTYLINHYKTLLGNQRQSSTKETKTISLQFTDHMVKSCIKMAQLNGPTESPISLAFIAIAGLLWVCISRIKGVTNGLIDISICSNMRKVFGLDQGFFGNCMIYNKVHKNGIEMNDLKLATKAIREAIEKVSKEGIMDLIEWLGHCGNFTSPFPLENGDLTFINLEDINPYEAMFMEGYEPMRVSYYSESIVGKSKVLVFPSHPHEGKLGKIVMVTLPKKEAIKLCEDNCLATYSPTIIMRANHSQSRCNKISNMIS